ncbi:MAG: response regulator [Bacteroidetes bacterium]|nr:MAG: response regulator [Bacteroidota bacterium]
MSFSFKYAILFWVALYPVSLLPAQSASGQHDTRGRFEIFQLPGNRTGWESENNVQCIVQDSLGFLWFGTANGLIRYDGQSYVTYRHNPADANSLASSYIESITIDSKGRLWLGHFNLTGDRGGMTLFDPLKESFTQFYPEPDNPNSLSEPRVSAIVEDRKGYIWIATFAGLDRYDPKTGTFKHFRHDPNDPTSLSYDIVRALYIDKQGTLWAGCGFPWDNTDYLPNETKRGGLNKYNPNTESFTRYMHEPGDPTSLADNRVRAILEDSKGNFWIGTMGNGLQQLDRQTGRVTRFSYDPAHPDRLSRPYLRNVPVSEQALSQVTFIHEDYSGRIWIGAFNGGLNIYDPATGKMEHFEQALNPGLLPSDFIWNIGQTRDGVHWIACGVGGGVVLKVQAEQDLFPYYSSSDLQEEREYIVGITEDRKGRLWLGSNGGSSPLTRFDRKTGAAHHFRYDPSSSSFPASQVFSLLTDREGYIWAGTEKGIFRFHPDNGLVRHYEHNPEDKSGLSCSTIEIMIEDRKGYIWAGTWGGGLERIDPKSGQIRHYRHDPSDPGSIGGSYVVGLLEDKNGNIWLAGAEPIDSTSVRRFIERLDPETGQIQRYKPKGPIHQPGLQLVELNDYIWYTAFPNGLHRLNKYTGEVTEFNPSEENEECSQRIISLVKGKDGRLWMTTWNNILCFDPIKETFFIYTRAHGLRSLVLAERSYYITPSGEHIVGGQGGLHTFFPEQLVESRNNKPPDVRITGFFLNNELVHAGETSLLKQPVWETGSIRLAHDQNTFAFNISCFDFSNPIGNQLEFQLEPYDPNWRTDHRDGQVAYFNVPPGEYTFRVRGANSRGVWGNEVSEMQIVILPPWWATWWAYTLYALFAFGIIYAIYHFLLKRQLAAAETARLQELDSVKTKLYTNITHEFRTPLTVISGMADQILEQPENHLQEGITMIKRNSNRLLNLVNQMLDLSKLESGKMHLHLQQGDVVNYLKYLVESFHSFAESKGIQIHFLSDLDALTMDYDPERLQQVISNLLSNAVKFTPANGNVYLSVNTAAPKDEQGAEYLQVKVRDTGIGIPEEQLHNIFDRFYQADDGHTRHSEGSGIGLSLTQELVKLMGGDIQARSQQGNGAEFTIRLPIHTNAELMPAPVPVNPLTNQNAGLLTSQPATLPENREAGSLLHAPAILLAEDNPDVVAYLASCLADEYQLAVARDGQEAIDIATEQIPDLVITDVMMPQKDGFEVCRTLRSDPRTSHIPIIMLTAKADVESKLEGLEQGADAYLAKPFHKKELLLRIRKLLELRQQLQQHYQEVAGLQHETSQVKDIPPVPESEDRFVLEARRIVEEHLDDGSFDVEQLCREMAMSHSQLHRKLSALTGFSATKFIRYLRLNKAKELLQNPALSITAIAYDTGFNDPSYFGRVFRQEFGATPQEWREKEVVPAV